MIVGITGHRVLAQPGAWSWVRQALTKFLGSLPAPLVGVTSLAIGADQLFAEVVLALGGSIEAIIPFADYERTFPNQADLRNYRHLRDAAVRVEVLSPRENDELSYLQAGELVVQQSQLVVAVWDGEAGQTGGTADIVKYALLMRKQLVQLDPLCRKIVGSKESL